MKRYKRLSWLLALALLLTAVLPGLAQAAEEYAAVEDFESGSQGFSLYSSSSGGFAVQNGKLVPTGDAGEFKAIYEANGRRIRAVSVEMHPNGNDGMFGGLYVGASNAGNGENGIDAYYVGIESNFAGWDDAPNRLDITLGKFNQAWAGEQG